MWELPWALVYIHASVATTLLHPFQGFQEEQTIQPNGAMAFVRPGRSAATGLGGAVCFSRVDSAPLRLH